MSGQTEATRQADWIYPPLAGNCYASVMVASTVITLNLATIGPQAGVVSPFGNVVQQPGGLVGHYGHFCADGSSNVYCIFGSTQASVSSTNAPVTSSTGTNVAGVCFPMPAGVVVPFKISVDTQWASFISTGTPTLRITLGSI